MPQHGRPLQKLKKAKAKEKRRPGHTWIGNRDKRIGVPAAVRRKGGTSSGGSDNGSGGGVSQGQHISGSSNGCDGRVCRWSMTTREVGVRHKFPSRKIVVLRRPKPKTIFHRGKKAMRTRPAAVRSSHLTNLPMECSGCSNLAEVVSFWGMMSTYTVLPPSPQGVYFRVA